MSEREPKINTPVFAGIDITPFMGTVSEPTFDDEFHARHSAYMVSVARRHPGHPELHEHEVGEEDMKVALFENQILVRFSSQYNIIDYFDIGSELLTIGWNNEDMATYNMAWMRFVTALELEPKSRVRKLLSQ